MKPYAEKVQDRGTKHGLRALLDHSHSLRSPYESRVARTVMNLTGSDEILLEGFAVRNGSRHMYAENTN